MYKRGILHSLCGGVRMEGHTLRLRRRGSGWRMVSLLACVFRAAGDQPFDASSPLLELAQHAGSEQVRWAGHEFAQGQASLDLALCPILDLVLTCR